MIKPSAGNYRSARRWVKAAAALVSVALAIAAVPHDGRTRPDRAALTDRLSAADSGPLLLDWPVVSPLTLVSML